MTVLNMLMAIACVHSKRTATPQGTTSPISGKYRYLNHLDDGRLIIDREGRGAITGLPGRPGALGFWPVAVTLDGPRVALDGDLPLSAPVPRDYEIHQCGAIIYLVANARAEVAGAYRCRDIETDREAHIWKRVP